MVFIGYRGIKDYYYVVVIYLVNYVFVLVSVLFKIGYGGVEVVGIFFWFEFMY